MAIFKIVKQRELKKSITPSIIVDVFYLSLEAEPEAGLRVCGVDSRM